MLFIKKLRKKLVITTLTLFLIIVSNYACIASVASIPNVQVNTSSKTDAVDSFVSSVYEKKDNLVAVPSIYLNFENASLSSVVNYLAEQKNINVIPHKDLDAQKITLTTREPMTLDRAWTVLLTLLEMNGYSIINVDNVYRIVTSKDNGQEPLPYYSSLSTDPEDLPDSDMVIRYIYFLKNIKVEIAQDILKTMLEGDRALQINRDLQACIIKEKCFNIKAAMKIIKELDTGGLRESIRIIRLKEIDAETIEKLFKTILGDTQPADRMRFISSEGQKESNYFSSATKIIAEPSKNNLILLGTEKNIDRIANFINKYIDIPLGSAESRLHIKEIRYAQAEKLRPILEQIIKPPVGSDKSIVVGQYKFFEDVIISSDTADTQSGRGGGNRLIIAANSEDWKRLEAFIDKLDKPQPQVAIEVLIAAVGGSQLKELGAQLQSKNDLGILGLNRFQVNNLSAGGSVNKNTTDTGAYETAAQRLIELALPQNYGKNSPSFLTLGRAGLGNENIWAIIRSVINLKSSNIVSQPFLVANNGQKCLFNVSQTLVIPGPLTTSKGEPVQATNVPTTAGTIINLTPQINSDGIIDLNIDMNIDQFVPASPLPPTTTTRKIITKVSLLTGEVLVIGGLVGSTQTVSTYKTPILSSIPFIGSLFSSKSKSKDEGDLYVFIRPSIIKPNFEGAPDEYTQLKIDYAKFQMIKNESLLRNSDPIQRWFFKPSNSSAKQAMKDAQDGVFRPIDDFATSKMTPKSVELKKDPHFRVTEAIESVNNKTKKKVALKSRRAETI